MKYRFMDRNGSGFEAVKMAEVLEVSRCGYYAHQRRPRSARTLEDEKLGTPIRLAWRKSRELYGAPRLTAAVLDLHNRAVVGWSLGPRLGDELVLAAVNQALLRHPVKKGLVIHADRGGRYRGHGVEFPLIRHGIRLSLGRRGDCYDNAAMELFFITLKSELVNRVEFKTELEARRPIYDSIEVYYNRQRRHATLNYRTPAEYVSVETHS